ncbi:hypothetical protein E4U25_004441 [Claviceps purpurea]|nr:hypothetical protein E4U25_004441 [Claviceps purpurea]
MYGMEWWRGLHQLDVAGMELHFNALFHQQRPKPGFVRMSIFVAWAWPGSSASSDLRLTLSDHITDPRGRGILLIMMMNEEER